MADGFAVDQGAVTAAARGICGTVEQVAVGGERTLFRTIVGARDAELLAAIEDAESPSRAERSQVADILASEFDDHVSGPDWEPTEHGRAVDALLGSFLRHFPVDSP